jgi:hypothetical protein
VKHAQKSADTKLLWTIIAFLCPVAAFGAVFSAGILYGESEAAAQISVSAGVILTLLALVAFFAALARGEKARWLTVFPLALMIGTWFVHL